MSTAKLKRVEKANRKSMWMEEAYMKENSPKGF